ncbi:MAG TPA: class I tRNA ligase family protein, partial [Diaminobutyricibacter sp.]
FFWAFCDDYLELVKERAYSEAGPGQVSAVVALRTALATLLRLFAPVVPFATEESWSWFNEGSVHHAAWPTASELTGDWDDVSAVLSFASQALTGIRRAKTDAKASQKTLVDLAVVAGPDDAIAALRLAADDLKAVGRIADLRLESDDALVVTDILLAPVPQTEESR